MNRTCKKKFKDTEQLDKLYTMYTSGMSISDIAREFDMDRTSVRYQLDKKFPLSKKEKKPKPQRCKKCTMLLDAPYHIKYPCIYEDNQETKE